MEPVTLGDHLRNRRLDLGLLQEEAATKLGVSSDTVRGWENNRHEPAIRHVPRILEFLGYVPFEPGPSLTERFRFARWTRGLSKRAMAARLGVDETTVRDWERGVHRPSRRNRDRLDALLVSRTNDR